MSLSVIPLTILGQITGVSGSGDDVLYQVSFKSIDGTPLYGVTAVWTDEQAEIEALAAQKPYGIWINPIDGTFTVKFADYTYVGTADLTDADVLAGVTPIEFITTEVSDRLLPEVDSADAGKTVIVNDDGEWVLGEGGQPPVVLYTSLMGTTGSKIVSAINALDNYKNYTLQSGVTLTNATIKEQIDSLSEDNFASSLLQYSSSTNPIYFTPDTFYYDVDSDIKTFVYKAVVNLFESGLGTTKPLETIYVSIQKRNTGSAYAYSSTVKGVSYDLRTHDAAYQTPANIYTQILSKMTSVLADATANNFAHDQLVVGSEADNADFANDIKQVAYMVSQGKTAVTVLGTTYGKPLFANYVEENNTHLYEFGTESFYTTSNYYYRISMWYHSSSDFGIVIDILAELMGTPNNN